MQAYKLKKEKRENPHVRNNQIAFRVNDEELEKLRERADQYTAGNISDFVRFASMHFEVQKKHLG